MTNTDDRLYDLLPATVRERDAAQGFPLRALLHVVGTQADVLEADIARLYEGWFIETCDDWLVPYLGDLVGYRLVHEAGLPATGSSDRDRARNRVLVPRRDVANTIRHRRRKGTRALLELLAGDVAGWPAAAVESHHLLARAQHVDHLRPRWGGTVNLRDGDALERIGGPFDEAAHTVDVRSRYNVPGVGLFVWRLRSYSVTDTPACCLDDRPNCYTFSIVGNDVPLFHAPVPSSTGALREVNLPAPIRRRRFERHPEETYGDGRSFVVRVDGKPEPLRTIVAADLDDWRYQPRRGQVAVDPERGRLAFPPGHAPLGRAVTVSYRYGFGGDIGGGEYERELSEPRACRIYPAVSTDPIGRPINTAIARWRQDQDEHASSGAAPDRSLANAVIELQDSGLYEEPLSIRLAAGESLQLRAANGMRPVLAVTNLRRAAVDAITIRGGARSRFTVDGLLVVGGAIQILGPDAYDPRELVDADRPPDDLFEVRIRHSTLVPGWTLACDCEPLQPAKPSLELRGTTARVVIERSITGSIEFVQNEVTRDPVELRIGDSIVDATDSERAAIDAPGFRVAHAALTIARSTVIGAVSVHAIELAENCILDGAILVARRQRGCVRYSYVTPGSRTPRRHICQPDTAVAAAIDAAARARAAEVSSPALSNDEKAALGEQTQSHVRPRFESRRYGMPTYCQLALSCPSEIARGADDEAEMGAFHDLFQPQRTANLTARLEEHSPAGMTATIIVAT